MKLKTHTLDFSNGALVMGILNVTPDSFSSGFCGKTGGSANHDFALQRASQMLEEGAHVIDIGGESTRPKFTPVPEQEEIARILPVVRGVAAMGAVVSVDTYKAGTAEIALLNGAEIINDVCGLRSEGMASVVAAHGAGVIITHNDGIAVNETANDNGKNRKEFVSDVVDWLRRSVDIALAAGIDSNKIILDPGIGFNKTHQQNLWILSSLGRIKEQTGFPILLAVSRKSVITRTAGRAYADEISQIVAALGVFEGVDMVRTHSVDKTVRATQFAWSIRDVD